MKKKNSAIKKLIPATSMLLVSATMLATSTYAWFTMSKEVEVQNIKLTASVPADLQISLGKLSTTSGSGNGLVNNQGTLVAASNGGTADNGGVAEPDGNIAEYWSNMADVSAYYAMGRIIPASSTDGLNVYYTPDSSGVGKTLKAGALYYSAVKGVTDTGDNGNSSDASYATLHAYTSKSGTTISDTWETATSGTHYTKAVTWNDTNDDGYYVDIPLWIRSSRKESVSLSVDAYVTTNSKKDNDDLYLAARAVILNLAKTSTSGLIEIKDGSYAGTESIVDFMSSTNPTGAAVSDISAEGGTATYDSESYYDGAANEVSLSPAGANDTYGAPTKIWVRVWLEGEDQNCWNENAGQDFNISLKFSEDAVTLPTTTHHYTAPADNTAASLVSGVTTTATVNGTALTYTYNGTTWTLTSGTFVAAPVGREYKINTTTIADQAALANYIKDNVTTKALADTGVTVTAEEVTGRTQVVATRATTWSYSASIPTAGVDHISVNGTNYADQTAMETAITADGTYTVYIIYS